MTPRRYIVFAIAALMALTLMGCPSPETETTEQPMADNDVHEVDVALGEWYVSMERSTVTPGLVEFHIRNEGDQLHALTIENADVEHRSDDIEPGESTTMTVDLSPGTYDAYCPIGNHREMGMEAEFLVEELL